MKRRYKGYNELNIKLLPEKAKRDYLLRLVSSIIIMAFVIINFFLVYLPRREYLSQVHDINRAIYFLESNYRNLFTQQNSMDTEIYNIKKNNDVAKIEEKEIDLHTILAEFESLKPVHSFTENITYNEELYSIDVIVQFDKEIIVYDYRDALESLDYVSEVTVKNVNHTSDDRYKGTFIIKLNIETAPKVGDVNE